MKIDSIGAMPLVSEGAGKTSGTGFAQRLESALKEVNTKQNVADESIEKVVQGELGIHEGMLAVQEADIALRAMVQVRSKVMQAYNEIMKMPV